MALRMDLKRYDTSQTSYAVLWSDGIRILRSEPWAPAFLTCRRSCCGADRSMDRIIQAGGVMAGPEVTPDETQLINNMMQMKLFFCCLQLATVLGDAVQNIYSNLFMLAKFLIFIIFLRRIEVTIVLPMTQNGWRSWCTNTGRPASLKSRWPTLWMNQFLQNSLKAVLKDSAKRWVLNKFCLSRGAASFLIRIDRSMQSLKLILADGSDFFKPFKRIPA